MALMYEYPMMIVTNTKNLFTKRAKRMKKIKAEEGSSD
jgi:formate dehydrogenase maturation protein FdhE